MRRRLRALVFFGALGAGACQLLVGDDDHHLRDDASDAASRDGSAGVTDSSVVEASLVDAGVDADVEGGGQDRKWRTIVLANGLTRPGPMLLARLIADNLIYVFFIDEAVADAGAILRVADRAALGTSDVLALAANPRALRIESGSGLFFTDDTRPVAHLMRVTVGPGSTPVDYDSDDTGRSFGHLSVISPYAYTEAIEPDDSGAYVRRTTLDASGGPDCFLYTSPQPSSFKVIMSDSNNVYFADTTSGDILRTVHGCNKVPMVLAAAQHAVAFWLGSTRLFWATADGHVRSLDKQLLGAITTYNAALVSPGGITELDGSVYVTDEGAGVVYEMTPTATAVVASGQGGPHGIGVSSDLVVYWTNRTSGEVVSARLADASPP